MSRPFLLAAIAIGLTSCATQRAPAPSPFVRVLVYNIHAGKDAEGADNLARVSDLVATTRADIVLLQEVDRGTLRSAGVDQVAELMRMTGYSAAFGRTLDYQGGQYGIATLSRWPIKSDTMIALPVTPPQPRAGGSYEPRGALRITVTHPGIGAPLDFVNTHLDPSGDPHYRRQEVAGVLRALAAAATPMTFLGGDLNATPDDPTIRSIGASAMRDAWVACGGAGAGHTFPASLPVKRIDYLWLPSGVTCVAANVIETQASDHRPLLVTLTVP